MELAGTRHAVYLRYNNMLQFYATNPVALFKKQEAGSPSLDGLAFSAGNVLVPHVAWISTSHTRTLPRGQSQ